MALANEFSRPVPIGDLTEQGEPFEIAATPEERRALAARFGLLGLDSLTAHGRVERVPSGGVIRLEGTLEAAVVQECVVSLEPVPATLREPLRRCYAVGAEREAPATDGGAGEAIVEPEEEVEPLTGDVLDLGETVAEELALALDPYPRAPDAEAVVKGRLGAQVTLNAPEEGNRPFTALLRGGRAG